MSINKIDTFSLNFNSNFSIFINFCGFQKPGIVSLSISEWNFLFEITVTYIAQTQDSIQSEKEPRMGKEKGLDLLTRKSKKSDHRIWNIGYGPYDIVSGLHITDIYEIKHLIFFFIPFQVRIKTFIKLPKGMMDQTRDDLICVSKKDSRVRLHTVCAPL